MRARREGGKKGEVYIFCGKSKDSIENDVKECELGEEEGEIIDGL